MELIPTSLIEVALLSIIAFSLLAMVFFKKK